MRQSSHRCRECLEIHAKTAMMADCAAIQELLHRVLPDILQGKAPSDIEQPWPSLTPTIAAGRFAFDRVAS